MASRPTSAASVMTEPGTVKAPSWLLALLEIPRALTEASSLIPAGALLRRLPQGDGHAVMTLPGFLASGRSMQVMRNYLEAWGYDAHCWDLGRNLGLSHKYDIEALLDKRLSEVHEQSGDKVSLVGWSLGGLLARELARRHPEHVRAVITLGSPIGDPKATNSWRLYEYLSDICVDDAAIRRRIDTLRDPIDGVPMTALYSETDAVVAADIAKLPPGPMVESIGVRASHFGMGFNPAILYLIADRLRHRPRNWTRFNIDGLRRFFFH